MARLADRKAELERINADLLSRLEARDARVRTLEERLRIANQLRQDVAKRIDELIGQIDQLDGELASHPAADMSGSWPDSGPAGSVATDSDIGDSGISASGTTSSGSSRRGAAPLRDGAGG